MQDISLEDISYSVDTFMAFYKSKIKTMKFHSGRIPFFTKK